ncbi:MAG: EAL domain-containing protein [Gammaproteobacteria bacterium]|nr:EAL domain-containing protein [Gammaproteobacteria bacterium]
MSSDNPLRILMVEDLPTDAELNIRELRQAGIFCTVERVETADKFRQALREMNPDIILSDFSLPSFDGMSALEIARVERPDTPFVFVSGTFGEECAVDALQLGATDYVLKNNLLRLGPAVRRALQEAHNRRARTFAEQALKHSEERFSQLAQHAPVGIFITDLKGAVVWANDRLRQISGLTAEQVKETGWAGVLHEDDRERVLHGWHAAVQSHSAYADECRFVRPDGTTAWVYGGATPLNSTSNADIGFIGTVMDITQHKLQEQKIARLSRIRAVSSAINGAIVRIRDRQALFAEACRIAVEQGGFRLAVLAMFNPGSGKLIAAAHHGADSDFIDTHLHHTGYVFADDGPLGTTFRERKPTVCNDIHQLSGHWRGAEAALAQGFRSLAALPLIVADAVMEVLLLYSAEEGFFDQEEMHLLEEIASDIAFALSYIEKEERLNYLAYYDTLTGLPNRALLEERLAHEVEHRQPDQKQPLALLAIGLEGVREIHEALGYPQADALLRQIGPRVRTILAESELVAFQGDEKFAVLLPQADTDYAIAKARQILGALAQSFPVAELSVNIRTNIGIALFPQHSNEPHALIRRANLAAQLAKNAEQDFAFYVPGLDRSSTRQLALAGELHQAIESGRLTLYCQPKVDLKTKLICGVEALVRWDAGGRGLILPGEFVPLAERIGLIRPLTQWMLEACARQGDIWCAAGLHIPIAVNLSFQNLHEPDLIHRIDDLLNLHGIQSRLLQLELTESTLMKDPGRALDTLTRLRGMGLEISIDDFGTGYSSLAYLQRLPVDAVKIDKSFVLDMVSNNDSNAIVESTITLAHQLGLRVVAEGVETPKAYKRLVELGCDEAQGYYIARPMPADDVAGWLQGTHWTASRAPTH